MESSSWYDAAESSPPVRDKGPRGRSCGARKTGYHAESTLFFSIRLFVISTARTRPFQIVHVSTVHQPLDTRIYYKEVRSLARAGFRVGLATTVDAASSIDGVELIPLGDRKGPRVMRLLRDIRALALMLANRDALFHVHDPELLVVAAVPAALGTRVVYDVHEFYRERISASKWIPQRLRGVLASAYSAVERLVLPHFAGAVVVSEEMLPRYRALLGDERVALVRNFPNLDPKDIENARKRPHPIGGMPYALHTGGAMRLRAFHDLVAAAERLRVLGSPLTIVNLGEVNLAEYSDPSALLERAKRAGVVMAGAVGYLEAQTWLAHARVGYLPLGDSENNRRGMPNKLFEYLLFGLPIVASDIGRVACIVTEARAGILVPIDSGTQHGDALARLHGDATAHDDFARNAQAASERYSFNGEFGALRDLYTRIANGNTR